MDDQPSRTNGGLGSEPRMSSRISCPRSGLALRETPLCFMERQSPQSAAEADCTTCRVYERCDPLGYRDDKA